MDALISIWNEAKARSDAIDRQIKEELRCRAQHINILLLGTDPDRSMFIKQMKIQNGLTKDERTRYRSTIYRNVLHHAQGLVRAIRDMGVEYVDPTNYVGEDHIVNCASFESFPEIARDIYQLWQDPIIPKVLNRRNEFWLGESAEYFFKEILRIASSDYLPSDNDVLQANESQSELLETRLSFGKHQVSIIDLARRHSVKKWIYFDDFRYAIFCVSLSQYDDVLPNSNSLNLLADSISVFGSVTTSRLISRVAIILFLTNTDVFKEKLSKIPIAQYFPEYTGGADFDKAIKYITWRFMQVNKSKLPVHVVLHPASNATAAQSIFEIAKHPPPRCIVETW